ncbi:MAG: YfhO family protein, partial [Candidatus Polarisedimenticolia bacterium]
EVLIEAGAASSGSVPPGPPGAGEGEVPGPEGGDEVPVGILADRPERVTLRLTAPRPGWVVLADAHAPGWTATLDGRPVELLRADGVFRAVGVGAGEHTIEMRYRVPGLAPGLGLGLLGAAGLVAAARFRGDRRVAAG